MTDPEPVEKLLEIDLVLVCKELFAVEIFVGNNLLFREQFKDQRKEVSPSLAGLCWMVECCVAFLREIEIAVDLAPPFDMVGLFHSPILLGDSVYCCREKKCRKQQYLRNFHCRIFLVPIPEPWFMTQFTFTSMTAISLSSPSGPTAFTPEM